MRINVLMKKTIAGAGILILALSLASCSAEIQENTGNATNSDSSTTQSESKSVYGIGDVISTDEFAITLNSAQQVNKDSFGLKSENGFFLILDVTIENKADEELSTSSIMSFDLKGSDDYTYDQSITVDKKGSLDGTIAGKSKLRGQIAYDVAKLDSYTFSFKPGLFGDPVSFIIQSSAIK